METATSFITALQKADPLVLVVLVCVVALLVVAECVRQVCKAFTKGRKN